MNPVVTTPAEWAALAGAWEALYRRCPGATPFLAHGWLSAYWDAFGEPGTLRVVCAHHPERGLIAAAPLRACRRRGVTTLSPIGAELADFSDVLLDPEVPDAADALAQALATLPGWQVLDLPEVPPAAAAWDLVRGWPGQVLARRASTCLELPVAEPEVLLAALPAKHRHDLRRQMRRVDRFDLRARLVPAEPDALAGAVAELLDLHAREWAGRGGNPLHLTAAFRNHLTASTLALVPAGRAALTRHLLDGRVVAVSLSLLTADMVGGYLHGADPVLRQHVDVSALMIRSALELGGELGARRLNMLRGAEAGKLRWDPRARHNQRVRLLPAAVGTGYAAAGAEVMVRAVADRLRGTRLGSRLAAARR